MSLARVARKTSLGQCAIALLLGLLGVEGAGQAETFDSAEMDSWRVWLEPKFMRPPVAEPFAGAKKTELTAGILNSEGLTGFTKDRFSGIGLDWATYEKLAKLNAAADLPKLRYHFERDRRKTVVYAQIESDQPVVASAVLLPGFVDLFEPTLGEKIIVVVPSRYTAILFPRLASDYEDFAPLVFRLYQETPYPVGVEVFEVSAGNWKCIGAYAEP